MNYFENTSDDTLQEAFVRARTAFDRDEKKLKEFYGSMTPGRFVGYLNDHAMRNDGGVETAFHYFTYIAPTPVRDTILDEMQRVGMPLPPLFPREHEGLLGILAIKL